MKLFSWIIIFTTLICLLTADETAAKKLRKKRFSIDNIYNILQLLPKATMILKDMNDLWNLLLREPDFDIHSAIFRSKEHEMIGRLLTISTKLSALEAEIAVKAETTVLTILQAFPKIIKLELNLHDLILITNQINFAEEQLRKYLTLGYKNDTSEEPITLPNPELVFLSQNLDGDLSPSNEEMSNNIMKREASDKWIIEKFTLLDFATWVTGHGYNSLLSLLRRMNDLAVGEENSGVFEMIKEVSQEMDANVCNLRQSPYQTIFNLYNTIAVAELKGITVLQFSYMLLKMYNKGNFTVEAELALQSYENYSKAKLEVVREALSDADRSIYRCDPKQYVDGVTYTKLTKLLQGYIENEVNLNPYGTCRENCQYYSYTEYNGCYQNQFCAKQRKCSGKVTECRYVDSDMNICTSSNSERRYDWVEYENGKILGTKGACERRNLFKVDSWWRYLFWHCSYCLCLCDDATQDSDRYFNLRDVTSDIEKNKILTGVRIVKENQIIHLQIQQGVLTPLGIVNKTSLSWKPVEKYTVDDDNVKNGVDYYTMSWLERTIDTDEVFGPPEHVVTGVRLRKIGTHLNLEVRMTPINFTTGEVLKAEHSYWMGNDNTDANPKNPRTEILLNNPDIPIRKGPHSLNSKHDQYIRFQPTSFETDVGQSTVPYLDSQALTSQGFPLSGIGLIHRGKPGSGGFIAPKLISYDYTPHLRFNRTN